MSSNLGIQPEHLELDNLYDAFYEGDQVIEYSRRARNIRQKTIRQAGLRLDADTGSRIRQAALGAEFLPDESGQLLILVVSSPVNESAAGWTPGLPVDMAEAVIDGALAVPALEDLGAGVLTFDRAEIHPEGSTPLAFQWLAGAVVRLLTVDHDPITDDDLTHVLESSAPDHEQSLVEDVPEPPAAEITETPAPVTQTPGKIDHEEVEQTIDAIRREEAQAALDAASLVDELNNIQSEEDFENFEDVVDRVEKEGFISKKDVARALAALQREEGAPPAEVDDILREAHARSANDAPDQELSSPDETSSIDEDATPLPTVPRGTDLAYDDDQLPEDEHQSPADAEDVRRYEIESVDEVLNRLGLSERLQDPDSDSAPLPDDRPYTRREVEEALEELTEAQETRSEDLEPMQEEDDTSTDDIITTQTFTIEEIEAELDRRLDELDQQVSAVPGETTHVFDREEIEAEVQEEWKDREAPPPDDEESAPPTHVFTREELEASHQEADGEPEDSGERERLEDLVHLVASFRPEEMEGTPSPDEAAQPPPFTDPWDVPELLPADEEQDDLWEPKPLEPLPDIERDVEPAQADVDQPLEEPDEDPEAGEDMPAPDADRPPQYEPIYQPDEPQPEREPEPQAEAVYQEGDLVGGELEPWGEPEEDESDTGRFRQKDITDHAQGAIAAEPLSEEEMEMLSGKVGRQVGGRQPTLPVAAPRFEPLEEGEDLEEQPSLTPKMIEDLNRLRTEAERAEIHSGAYHSYTADRQSDSDDPFSYPPPSRAKRTSFGDLVFHLCAACGEYGAMKVAILTYRCYRCESVIEYQPAVGE